MKNLPIPFHRPHLSGRELGNIQELLASGRLGADGVFSARCCKRLEEEFAARRCLLVPSCTAALEMAAILLQSKDGAQNEVIVPSFTFVSTANAFVLYGYRPVFVDVERDTLCMDPAKVRAALTPRTRAIVPVHYAGIPAKLDELLALGKAHGVAVVEDAAQAVGARWKGQQLGTFGDLGTFSFHDSKNLGCGEGGALIVNRPELVERAEIIRDKGTNRRKFFRGEVDKYTWVDTGSSFVLSEILAAFLAAQLDSIDAVISRRRILHETYMKRFASLAAAERVQLPVIPADVTSNYHLFWMMVADLNTRTRLITHLAERGIGSTFHYVPLHRSPMGQRMGASTLSLPVTEAAGDRLIRLPLYTDLKDEEIDRVCTAVLDFFRKT